MKSFCLGLYVLLFYFVGAASKEHMPYGSELTWINVIIAIFMVIAFVLTSNLSEKIQPETKGTTFIAVGVAFNILVFAVSSSRSLSMMISGGTTEKIITSLIVLLMYVAPFLIFLKTIGNLLIVIGLIKFFATIGPERSSRYSSVARD
ncbi:MAG: hypothetical protein EON54_05600 [Alcaligenaceae bacterium]|nr:MAG: hypothetical protein EON54_05600 [Alcaligenaceae bacterium]